MADELAYAMPLGCPTESERTGTSRPPRRSRAPNSVPPICVWRRMACNFSTASLSPSSAKANVPKWLATLTRDPSVKCASIASCGDVHFAHEPLGRNDPIGKIERPDQESAARSHQCAGPRPCLRQSKGRPRQSAKQIRTTAACRDQMEFVRRSVAPELP